ncbi:PSD1 and planctomycete cytochrome C domain-containing protein, partial [bacterium]|nr:PSD1 and planctomycete cytochrome C domain-containing protein [bacterium]
MNQFVGVALTFALVLPLPSVADVKDPVDFQRQIRPILAELCFECHGPDEAARKANLRLDEREGALASAIVPGKPLESELIRRVRSSAPDVVMPPAEHQNALNPNQITLLERWIAEGAPYTKHWAFIAPSKAPTPASGDEPIHPIDAFIEERLAIDSLHFSPPAPDTVLCRRLYLDLIGLPPSPSEIDAFVEAAKKDRSEAVAELVNHLLASKHFGEKWARHWLDVARYADTDGYEADDIRQQWSWRDWVVRAINADMPYDQFIVEQIAGDLLPDRSQDQLVATGFLRNSMTNGEAAILYEEFRMESIFDRMDCIGKAVLGLSLQCAQCHTHKFDPITHDEYYGMFAFLNDTHEAQSHVYDEEQLSTLTDIHKERQKVEDEIKAQRPDWRNEIQTWEKAQLAEAPNWEVIDTTKQEYRIGGIHPEELPDHSVLSLGHPVASELALESEPPSLEGVTGLRVEALLYGDLPHGGPGRSRLGVFEITDLKVEWRAPGSEEWSPVALQEATADYSAEDQVEEREEEEREEEEHEDEEHEDEEHEDEEHEEEEHEEEEHEEGRRLGPVAYLIDDNDDTAWRADRGNGQRNTESVAVVRFAKPLTVPSGTHLKITLMFSETKQVGRLRLALTTSPEPRATHYDHAATLAMQKPISARNDRDRAALFKAWRQCQEDLVHHKERLAAIQNEYPEAETTVLCVQAREPNLHRPTHLLERGIWDRKKHRVTPHVTAALHSMTAEQPNRLSFAHWLADTRSPLTARVQVNRVWQAIFGRGLVDSPEDFGTRTPPPVHGDLLDWLAVDFMEHGWSLKEMLRCVTSSRTYQQSARITPELLELDPSNRILARGPRFRVEAETVRDIALSVSGLLVPDLGGPPVFPPEEALPPEEDEHRRRSLYLFRKRNLPDPLLNSFDAPNGQTACAQRVRTNTPLAALAALNDPIFTEAARALALRILLEGGETDADRADYAFRLCTGRPSKAAERTALLALLK